MIELKRARIFAGPLSATLLGAAAVFGSATFASAFEDGPPVLTEDVSEEEARPPNSSDEGAENRQDTSDPPAQAPAPESDTEPPAAKPEPRSPAADLAAREAAKRALLSDPNKQDAKPNPLLDRRGPDYYDRRAKGLLESEHRDDQLHPLMQAHPDSYVVVCTGGCPTGKPAGVVSIVPKRQPASEVVEASQQTDASAQITCVAGCGPKGPSAFDAAPAPAAEMPVAQTIGEWMTTVAVVPAGTPGPMPKSPGGSGEWMEKIRQDRASASPNAAAMPQPVNAAKPAPAPAATKAEVPPRPLTEMPPETQKAVAPASLPAVVAKSAEPSPVAPEARPEPVAQSPSSAPAATVIESSPAPAQNVIAKEAPERLPAPSREAQPEPRQMAAVENSKSAPLPVMTAPAAPLASPVVSGAAAQASESKPASTIEDKTSGHAAAAAAPQSTTRQGDVVAAVPPPAAENPAAAVPPTAPKDGVISVLSEDQAMNAAIEKARASLPVFWKSYDGPAASETDHALKVAIAGNGTTEHFWLTRIRREGGKLSGVISNRPQSVTSVKLGQRYQFTPETVSDWTFKRNGKLVGNETMRALLPRMPEEQAAVYRQMYETP